MCGTLAAVFLESVAGRSIVGQPSLSRPRPPLPIFAPSLSRPSHPRPRPCVCLRFKRSSRAAAAGTVASVSAVGQPSPEEAAAKAAEAAAEKARYELLKVEFQGWTLAFGLLGGVTAYYVYGTDAAISFALGSSAGLTYLRLLSRSVDAGGWGGCCCLGWEGFCVLSCAPLWRSSGCHGLCSLRRWSAGWCGGGEGGCCRGAVLLGGEW